MSEDLSYSLLANVLNWMTIEQVIFYHVSLFQSSHAWRLLVEWRPVKYRRALRSRRRAWHLLGSYAKRSEGNHDSDSNCQTALRRKRAASVMIRSSHKIHTRRPFQHGKQDKGSRADNQKRGKNDEGFALATRGASRKKACLRRYFAYDLQLGS